MRPQGFSRPALVFLAAGMIGLVAGCGSARSSRATGGVDVSGQWLGTWTAPGEDGTRSGAVIADFTQVGSKGKGKLVLHDTLANEDVPVALRHAGAGGIPVMLSVSGVRLRVEHQLGSELMTARFEVIGDRMVGYFEHSNVPVRIMLARVPSSSAAVRTASAEMPKGAEMSKSDRSLAKAVEPDAGSQLAAVRTLAEQAASTADAAASLAREASAKAEASTATAGEALAKVEQSGRGPSDPRSEPLHGGPLQAVASRVVTFAFDKADLDDAAQTALGEVAKQTQEHPNFLVNLEGYTDPVGTRDYNVQLSQRRATAVLRYLVGKGVELSHIHWVGLGMLSGSGAPEEQAKKRRVTVTVFSATPGGAQASADPQPIQPLPQ